VTEVTGEMRVIALDRLWPGDAVGRGGDLLDIVFGWSDLGELRRLVAGHCAAAGLTAAQVDDFVLAIHEISANAIMHAGASGRLILRRAGNGLRCLVADSAPAIPNIPPASAAPEGRNDFPGFGGGLGAVTALPGEPGGGERQFAGPAEPDGPAGPIGAETGRGLWLAAQLADELRITSGPDSTIVSLYMCFE
jgi:anti-sigma regulatory factor (Ser/Thr protein kinase)